MTERSDEDRILAEMLRAAERLCETADALMSGQYRHLHDRIRALIALRDCVLDPDEPAA